MPQLPPWITMGGPGSNAMQSPVEARRQVMGLRQMMDAREMHKANLAHQRMQNEQLRGTISDEERQRAFNEKVRELAPKHDLSTLEGIEALARELTAAGFGPEAAHWLDTNRAYYLEVMKLSPAQKKQQMEAFKVVQGLIGGVAQAPPGEQAARYAAMLEQIDALDLKSVVPKLNLPPEWGPKAKQIVEGLAAGAMTLGQGMDAEEQRNKNLYQMNDEDYNLAVSMNITPEDLKKNPKLRGMIRDKNRELAQLKTLKQDVVEFLTVHGLTPEEFKKNPKLRDEYLAWLSEKARSEDPNYMDPQKKALAQDIQTYIIPVVDEKTGEITGFTTERMSTAEARDRGLGKNLKETLYGLDGIGTTAGFPVTEHKPEKRSATEAGAIGRMQTLIAKVDHMLHLVKYIPDSLMTGTWQAFSVTNLGGLGIDDPGRLSFIRQAKELVFSQAFAEGGKQLTAVEKEVFQDNSPGPTDTMIQAVNKLHSLRAAATEAIIISWNNLAPADRTKFGNYGLIESTVNSGRLEARNYFTETGQINLNRPLYQMDLIPPAGGVGAAPGAAPGGPPPPPGGGLTPEQEQQLRDLYQNPNRPPGG